MRPRSLAAVFFLAAFIVIPIAAQAQPITTVAGGGVGDGGPAVNANINAPYSVAVDAAGNLYIAGPESSRVRRVDAITHVITTVAGTGVYGDAGDGGLATSALLRSPVAVAVDADGTIYIADQSSQRIRRVDPSTHVITTYAGLGETYDAVSGDGGPATSAAIGWVQDIALDGAGNLFLVSGPRIRRVAKATGTITTVAGNGQYPFNPGDNQPATSVAISVMRLVVDAAGNIYYSDSNFNRIRKVSTAGMLTTVAGTGQHASSGDGGPALSAALYPNGITLDAAGNILFFDMNNGTLRKVTLSTGRIDRVAGTPNVFGIGGDGGPALSATFRAVVGIAADGAGNIYLTDATDYRVRQIDSLGIIAPIAGNGTRHFFGEGVAATIATLYSPRRLTFDASGNLVFSDAGNNRVRRVDTSTGFITTIAGREVGYNVYPVFSGDGGPAPDALLYTPLGIGFDGQGNLFVADSSNSLIRRVNTAGTITTYVNNGNMPDGSAPTGIVDPQMFNPDGIAVDAAGDLYIPEYARVSRVDAVTGAVTTVAGRDDFQTGFDGDGGPAVGASLYSPSAVALDAAGNLFIADNQNNRIRRVDAVTGIITTVAGTPGPDGGWSFGGDGGDARDAQLGGPNGIAFSAAGHMFITDTYNNRIRRVDAATGIITTVVGNGTADVSPDGTDALSAGLYYPIALAVRGNTLYYAETTTDRIRKIDLPFSKSTPTITWAAPAPMATGAPLGAAQLNATARIPGTFVYSPAPGTTLGIGTQTLSVTFTPADTANFNGNTASVTITVTKADTATVVSSGANPSTVGQSVTFTATVTGFTTPAGTVTFSDGATALGSAALAANGKATLTTSSLSTGDHSITAVYSGNSTFNGSTSAALTQTVQAAGNTQAGSGVAVAPVDTTTGGPSPITLTFSNVTSAGTTTVTSSPGGLPPTGYLLFGIPPKTYDITTTAHYSGSITVCLTFTGGGTPRLFHDAGHGYVDITSGYPAPNVVCGTTTSLSPFALFISAVQQLVDTLTNAIDASNLKPAAKAALIAVVKTLPAKLEKLSDKQRKAELAKVDAVINLLNALVRSHDIDTAKAAEWLAIANAIDAALRAS